MQITEQTFHWHGGVTATILFDKGILIKKTFDSYEQFEAFKNHFGKNNA